MVASPNKDGSRVIGLRYLYAPEPYDRRIETYLRAADFYNVSQIQKISRQTALINALVERWNLVTHTFHLPIGECTITLEDVALILGVQGTGLPVTGPTNSNHGSMVQECLMNFGVAPTAIECRGSFIKLTWLRNVKHGIILNSHEAMERYSRCHIMSLFGTTLFADKSGAGVYWKFLSLLRDIPRIRTYSWGSACLAH
ncbi:protein MAIN-LIKE 2-like [Arachis hypogaea]|uniref:protein MAIN-LIKE 2-like n=1 Tax=Arachis hypogaea TaxID=3818 RepID=UPI000DEC7B5D|nr:protein MAIN-LIKE 2-like [Arachis hypogaea]